MAAKKATKRGVAKPKIAKPVLDTKEQVIEYLMKQWSERDPDDPLIAIARKALEPGNPMKSPPSFIADAISEPVKVRHDAMDDLDYVWLGRHHGYAVYLRSLTEASPRRGVLKWGCRKIRSEEQARAHWYMNQSTQSGERRPRATDLIDYAAKVFRHLNWKW